MLPLVSQGLHTISVTSVCRYEEFFVILCQTGGHKKNEENHSFSVFISKHTLVVLSHLPPKAKALRLQPEGHLASCCQSIPTADWIHALDTVWNRFFGTQDRVSWKQHTLSALFKLLFLARTKEKPH